MIANPKPVNLPVEEPEGQTEAPSEADCARRQDDLLDEGLLETFPASDPVSVVRPKGCP